MNNEQNAALKKLRLALVEATQTGLLDLLAAELHPNTINSFCDAVNGTVTNAVFTSVWDGGIHYDSAARVNLDTRSVEILEMHDGGVDIFEQEYVTVEGKNTQQRMTQTGISIH